jgi:FkbM family methyltransferase
VDRYTTKRRLLRPVTAFRRWRRGSHLSPYTRQVYEAHDYRPSMRRFFQASREHPDILIDVDLPDGGTAVDVGAFVGEWSERILARADARGVRDLRIVAFEPEPHALDELRAGVGQDPRVEIFEFGLAGSDSVQQMAIDGPGSSVYVGPGALGLTEISLRDADAALAAASVERIDFLKINIEGGEFELIDRLHETGWLARTGTILIQFHEFGPDAYAGRRRNRAQLAQTHRCTWNYTWVYERWDPK